MKYIYTQYHYRVCFRFKTPARCHFPTAHPLLPPHRQVGGMTLPYAYIRAHVAFALKLPAYLSLSWEAGCPCLSVSYYTLCPCPFASSALGQSAAQSYHLRSVCGLHGLPPSHTLAESFALLRAHPHHNSGNSAVVLSLCPF